MRKTLFVFLALTALFLSSLVWSASSSAITARGGTPQSADVILGTYDLPGGSVSNPGEVFNSLSSDVRPPCQDCDITSVTPDLTDVNGTSVNMDTGPMLHHVVLYQQGASDVSCPGEMPAFGMRRLFASGNERTAIPQVPGHGLYVTPDEQFAVLADLMNYSPQAQTVQIRLHVTYLPGNTLTPITPVWLDETGCGFSYLDVPAGPSHQSTTWTSTINGKILGLGGHLHEYGVHIAATDETTHTPLCDSKESQMTMPNGLVMVTEMSTCVGTGPDSAIADLHQGDTIGLDSYYNPPQAESGVMGIMIMYVAES